MKVVNDVPFVDFVSNKVGDAIDWQQWEDMEPLRDLIYKHLGSGTPNYSDVNELLWNYDLVSRETGLDQTPEDLLDMDREELEEYADSYEGRHRKSHALWDDTIEVLEEMDVKDIHEKLKDLVDWMKKNPWEAQDYDDLDIEEALKELISETFGLDDVDEFIRRRNGINKVTHYLGLTDLQGNLMRNDDDENEEDDEVNESIRRRRSVLRRSRR